MAELQRLNILPNAHIYDTTRRSMRFLVLATCLPNPNALRAAKVDRIKN